MKVVLYSIKPKFVEQILIGTKLFEYRKKVHADTSIKYMLIYATSPMKRVVAKCEIVGILYDSPNAIWEKTKNLSGITKKAFFTYFVDTDRAHAIQISNLKIFKRPKYLSDFGLETAPQSFIYVQI